MPGFAGRFRFHGRSRRTNARAFTVMGPVAAVLVAGIIAPLPAQVRDSITPRVVARDDLIAAMRAEQRKGYSLTATTNGARFQGEVILALVRRARAQDPAGGLLLIDHRDNLAAFMSVTGLAFDRLPQFVQLAYQHRQDQIIDHRPGQVNAVERGPQPGLAVTVRALWPDSLRLPDSFSYHDTLSNPHVRVTTERLVTYRLVDFGDWLLYDEVEGVSGRPTSGILGVLFRVIGDGRAAQSRIAISRDSLQLVHSEARKGFVKVNPTVVVYPDGRAVEYSASEHPDLVSLSNLIRQPLKLRYAPLAR